MVCEDAYNVHGSIKSKQLDLLQCNLTTSLQTRPKIIASFSAFALTY